jgi:COP9 signalosome complex subunit 3
MVSFHDNPEKYDNPLIMDQLNKQIFKCIEMDSNIKKMDKEITTHPLYIQKCQVNSNNNIGNSSTTKGNSRLLNEIDIMDTIDNNNV